MWHPAGGKVCEMGRLGARRGGTHLLCVCPSFPESPQPGGQGGASRLHDLRGSQGARACLLPVVLEGGSEARQVPPGSAALGSGQLSPDGNSRGLLTPGSL